MPALSKALVLPPLRWFLALLKVVLVLLLIGSFAHIGWMLWDGFTEELDNESLKAHVAVVFGNEIMPDGKPSARLKARLDRAIELYENAQVETIIVSGGVDDEGHDEATIMGRYLVRNGIPKEVVEVDSLGDNTFLTAANVKRMLQYRTSHRLIVVITSYHHILRAKLALKKCGFNVVYGAYGRHFEWRDIWYSIPKELVAYYRYLNGECPDAVRF